ncbi:hypothetical protein BJX66DRAFT_142043 [Aspergillus keveii]|uniref:F-box domain-containing protein n=1 Tax=Aspergillus keveii TaxID=714993 RepID=A0ABR4GC38_9EURO
MHHLPIEIIQYICRWARDDGCPDLYPLRLVNRRCCLAVTPVVFDNLTIKLRAGITVHDLLLELDDSGIGRHYLQYTRRLNLVCIRHWLPRHTTRGLKELEPNLFGYIPRAATDSFLTTYLTTAGVPGSDYERWKWILNFYKPESWKPLVDLVAKFHRLVELNYGLADMFPPALAEAIRLYHPSCAVNIWNGYLPATAGNTSQRISLDALSSLNPRSFVAVCPAQNMETPDHVYGILLRETLPGLASCSNLKHLTIHWGNCLFLNPLNNLVEDWYTRPQSMSRPCLQSLTLQGRIPLTSCLGALSSLYDLSQLHSLDLTASFGLDVLRQAALLFKHLQKLYVTLDAEPYPVALRDIQDRVDFIQSFNPLQFLCLRGVREERNIREILAVHGSTLQGLVVEVTRSGFGPDCSFQPRDLSPLCISDIAEACPNLRELRIPILRTKGDRYEYTKYKALGQFNHLRTLIIDLLCDPRSIVPSDQVPSLMDMIGLGLANAATDRKLIESIWNVIFQNQSSKRLRELSCIHLGSECFPWTQQWVMLHLAQSFLVRRPGLATDPIQIEPIGRKSLALRMEEKYRTGGRSGMDENMQEAFDKLWPGDGPWETRWRSLPLDTSGIWPGTGPSVQWRRQFEPPHPVFHVMPRPMAPAASINVINRRARGTS